MPIRSGRCTAKALRIQETLYGARLHTNLAFVASTLGEARPHADLKNVQDSLKSSCILGLQHDNVSLAMLTRISINFIRTHHHARPAGNMHPT